MTIPAKVTIKPKPEHWRLFGYESRLTKIHRGYDEAARKIEGAIGTSLCVSKCGRCCECNSPLAFGIESEVAAMLLLGNPKLINPVLDRCREWLTAPGKYTYGRKLTPELWDSLQPEFESTAKERCPMLTEDKGCLIHVARPLVCRAYGVTRIAGAECPRPLGIGEGVNQRCTWDGHDPSIGLYEQVGKLMNSIPERRFNRSGFFMTMLFERFRAKELAGLLDDGKVPLVKMFASWGEHRLLLWQDQLDVQWRAEAADASIKEEVPLKDRGGVPVMVLERGKVR